VLEGKGNLARMLAEIQLDGDEGSAVSHDATPVANLRERLADGPTPADPTTRQMATFLPIDDLVTGEICAPWNDQRSIGPNLPSMSAS
jgi:hypothetical protein